MPVFSYQISVTIFCPSDAPEHRRVGLLKFLHGYCLLPISRTNMVLSAQRKILILMMELKLTEGAAASLLRVGKTKRKRRQGREQRLYRYEINENVVCALDAPLNALEDPEDEGRTEAEDVESDDDLGSIYYKVKLLVR